MTFPTQSDLPAGGMTPSDQSTKALEPELTKHDRRILGALDQWTDDRDFHGGPLHWMNVWQVGQEVREYDLVGLKATLDGLVEFDYALATGWGPTRRWIAAPWKRECRRKAVLGEEFPA